MHLTGTLKSWHDGCGFGFIEATHGGQEIFVVDSRRQPAPVTALLSVSGAAVKGAHDGLDTPVYRLAPSHHMR